MMEQQYEHKNWFESTALRQEHIRLTQQAIQWWIKIYPDKILDINQAQEEWCLANNFPRDFLLLGKTGKIISPKQAETKLNFEYIMRCPVCGAAMDFDIPPQCHEVNPHKYSGVFTCSAEGCLEHFYTKQGLIDIMNLIRDNKADQIIKVEGIV